MQYSQILWAAAYRRFSLTRSQIRQPDWRRHRHHQRPLHRVPRKPARALGKPTGSADPQPARDRHPPTRRPVLDSERQRRLRACQSEPGAVIRSLGRSVAQPGRALSSGGRGREFESRHSDQFSNTYLMLCARRSKRVGNFRAAQFAPESNPIPPFRVPFTARAGAVQ